MTSRAWFIAAPALALTFAGLALGSPVIAAAPAQAPPQAGTTTPPTETSGDAAGAAVVSATNDPLAEENDRKLYARLLELRSDEVGQTRYCLDVAWSPQESDEGVRSAALRRLRGTNPRVVAAAMEPAIGQASPAARVAMLELMGDLYPGLGGTHPSVDAFLCEQIRYPEPSVAKSAMSVCSRLGIPGAYLPLRELASRPGSSLRNDAIAAMAQLRDPRAVDFFGKLLDSQGAPREQIFRALAQMGRPSALLLKTKIDDADPQVRSLALNALLEIATVDDLSSLYAYIQKYPPEGELKRRVYDTIADLEAKGSERPMPSDG